MRGGTGRRTGRRRFAALMAGAGLLASAVRAEEPRVACTATQAGRRVVVRPEVAQLVAPELERLMRLGMAGQLEVELSLRRRRFLWLDERLEGAQLTHVLAFMGKEEGWVLDGRPLSSAPRLLELERVAWTLEREPESSRPLVVEVRVRLQVVTAASLGRVAQWLTEQGGSGEDRSALARRLLLTVAEDLTRQAVGQCTVEPSVKR
jgi:hypothetical protein